MHRSKSLSFQEEKAYPLPFTSQKEKISSTNQQMAQELMANKHLLHKTSLWLTHWYKTVLEYLDT